MEPIGFPETSVRNYSYTLRNTPEERRSHLLRGRILTSRISVHLVELWQPLLYNILHHHLLPLSLISHCLFQYSI